MHRLRIVELSGNPNLVFDAYVLTDRYDQNLELVLADIKFDFRPCPTNAQCLPPPITDVDSEVLRVRFRRTRILGSRIAPHLKTGADVDKAPI